MGRKVAPLQKTGLNSIPRWEVGGPWDFNRVLFLPPIAALGSIVRGRAEPWFDGDAADISNFSGAAIWNSAAYFAGRYTLELRVPVAIDYEHCRVKDALGPAEVEIRE